MLMFFETVLLFTKQTVVLATAIWDGGQFSTSSGAFSYAVRPVIFIRLPIGLLSRAQMSRN